METGAAIGIRPVTMVSLRTETGKRKKNPGVVPQNRIGEASGSVENKRSSGIYQSDSS